MVTDFLGNEIKVGDFVVAKNSNNKGSNLMIAEVIKVNKKSIDIKYKPEMRWMSEYIWGEYKVANKKDSKNVVLSNHGKPADWETGYNKPCWGNKELAQEYKERYPNGYLGKAWKD